MFAAGLARTFPLPAAAVFDSSFDTTADILVHVSRSGDTLLQNENEAIHASVHSGVRPLVSRKRHPFEPNGVRVLHAREVLSSPRFLCPYTLTN